MSNLRSGPTTEETIYNRQRRNLLLISVLCLFIITTDAQSNGLPLIVSTLDVPKENQSIVNLWGMGFLIYFFLRYAQAFRVYIWEGGLIQIKYKRSLHMAAYKYLLMCGKKRKVSVIHVHSFSPEYLLSNDPVLVMYHVKNRPGIKSSTKELEITISKPRGYIIHLYAMLRYICSIWFTELFFPLILGAFAFYKTFAVINSV